MGSGFIIFASFPPPKAEQVKQTIVLTLHIYMSCSESTLEHLSVCPRLRILKRKMDADEVKRLKENVLCPSRRESLSVAAKY